ncbi:MAG: OmpA family protein [Gemmatimonadetes bacterium]|nr:OmpA family protein [Gemmatimonadota bacterium]
MSPFRFTLYGADLPMPKSVTTPYLGAATLLLAALASPLTLYGQGVVSRFAGSVEKGGYEADYDALLYPTTIHRAAEPERLEGALISRIYIKPEGKSNLELFRSYESELTAAGFEILQAETPGQELKWLFWKLYRPPYTNLEARSWKDTEDRISRSDLGWLGGFVEYYILARGAHDGGTRHVAVLISGEHDLYMVEELRSAERETGTVTLTVDALRTAIESAGKVAVYDIHFATGSAAIEPSSAEALGVIAEYLRESGDRYYVVGHTDDTGGLAQNLELSGARAASVKAALVSEHGIAGARLETRGVGPLAPVSTNGEEQGRSLNRRVEIVLRLEG